MREEIQKDMKQQMLSIEQAQKETQEQLEELLKYFSKAMGKCLREALKQSLPLIKFLLLDNRQKVF